METKATATSPSHRPGAHEAGTSVNRVSIRITSHRMSSLEEVLAFLLVESPSSKERQQQGLRLLNLVKQLENYDNDLKIKGNHPSFVAFTVFYVPPSPL